MGRKRNDRRGFTLIEVLAVVAIIVVLIAIAIPSFMSAINHTRHEADAKYERAAAALATGLWQTNSLPKGAGAATSTPQYLYDPENGKLVIRESSNMDLTPYPAYGECGKEEHKGKRLWVQVNTDTGKIDLFWAERLTGTSTTWNGNLCDP